MNSYNWISDATTMLTIDASDSLNQKVILLPNNLPKPDVISTGRFIYLKETSGIPGCKFILSAPTGTVLYPSTQQLDVIARQCVLLQEYPTNIYNLMDGYIGNGSFSTMETPSVGSQPVSVDGTKSVLFVDLQTQSKTVVLPPIPSLSQQAQAAPYFLIKDVYGNAYTNTLFLSTMGGASIDGLGPSIGLHYNYSAIELTGDLAMNRWHIVNYYDGN